MKLRYIAAVLCLGTNLGASLGPKVSVRYIEENDLYAFSEFFGATQPAGRRYFIRIPNAPKREGLYFIFEPAITKDKHPRSLRIEAQSPKTLRPFLYEIPWPQDPKVLRQELSIGLTQWPNKHQPLFWRIQIFNTQNEVIWEQESVGACIETFKKTYL